jgi:uncharacterized Zn finger protein
MSRWSWYAPAPKQPVPDDGLRVDRFGVTWWGEQWIRALNRLGRSYTNRLPRGRSYARAGRVANLVMGAGEATASVVGSRRKPYSVSIKLKAFSKKTWNEIVGVLAGRARFSVALLRGEIPPEIREALGEHGIELFPVSGRDIETSCSCPDWANPCKHVAAVHYVVAAALDSDPFLIFVLRGLDRQALLGALAEARGMHASPPELGGERPGPEESQWEDPDEMDEGAFLGKSPLPQLAFNVRPATVDLAGLARLGPPPPALLDLPKRLGPGIRAAARAALALAESGDSLAASHASEDDDAVRGRVIEFVRGRSEGATMLLLRSRLPDGKEVLHRVVRAIRDEGLLKSSGWGAATRYKLVRESSPSKAGHRGGRSSDRRKSMASQRPPTTDSTPSTVDEKVPQAEAPLVERITVLLAEAAEPLPLREIARLLEHPVDGGLRKAVASLRTEGAVVMVGNRRGARYTVRDSR